MLQYVLSQSDNDNFIITIMDGEWKGVAVKVVDLRMDKEGFLDFDIELPKNKTELFTNEEFKENISEIVGEVFKKSVESIYKQQEELSNIEVEVTKILENHKVKRENPEELLIETFMKKNYLLKVDKDDTGKERYLAINIKTNTAYDLNVEEDFEKVRIDVFPNIILN